MKFCAKPSLEWSPEGAPLRSCIAMDLFMVSEGLQCLNCGAVTVTNETTPTGYDDMRKRIEATNHALAAKLGCTWNGV